MRKEKSMMKHFRRRLHERFGITITDDEIKNIISLIRNGRFKQICKVSNTRSLYKILVANTPMVVVYNRERRAFHTCFPIEWMKEEKFTNMLSEYCIEYVPEPDCDGGI